MDTLEWLGNESLKGSTYSMREYDEKLERELRFGGRYKRLYKGLEGGIRDSKGLEGGMRDYEGLE